MSCTTCYSHICTCNNEVFCDGLKGDRGDRGDRGPDGENGIDGISSTFIDTEIDQVQRFPSIPYYTVMSYTVTEPGDYLMMYECDVNVMIVGTTLNYRAAKNGIAITNSERVSSPYLSVGNKIKKNKLHVGISSLIEGDVITIEYNNNKRYYTNSRSLTMLKVNQLTIL